MRFDRVRNNPLEVLVIQGPKTRLAEKILSQAQSYPDSYSGGVVCLARNKEEKQFLEDKYRDSSVISVLEIGESLPYANNISVICTALGPIHVETPSFEKESSGLKRDLEVIEKWIASPTQVHLIFISSILALAPSRSRFFYAGSKLMVEGVLQKMAEKHGARLSVFYPGRLMEGEGILKSLLHTPYERLASQVLKQSKENAVSGTRIVGVDSFLLLVARCLSRVAMVPLRLVWP